MPSNGRPVAEVTTDGMFAAACSPSRPEITVETSKDGKQRKVTRTFRFEE